MTPGDLYHEAMVALARAAHGAGRLPAPDATATLDNPLCGDRVTIDVQLAGERIGVLGHRVRGCLLCEAAASLLARAAPGATVADVETGRAALEAILRGEPAPEGRWTGLELFTPVSAVPSRHRCTLLPFDALRDALRARP